MQKILKTQGTFSQWIDLTSLSFEQMGLNPEIEGNTVVALLNGTQVMKVELNEDNGIILTIDYYDERDLDDFKKFAAQIINDPDSYRSSSKFKNYTPVPSQAKPADNINDYTQQTEPDYYTGTAKPKKNKGLVIALIILGAVVVLAAAGFFGYKFYQSKKIPETLMTEAQLLYNAGDYDTAITVANEILRDYPNSSQANLAQSLITNAQAEIDKINAAKTAENELNARIQSAKSMFTLNSQVMTGPDSDGDVHLFFGYTNNYTADITSVTFTVNFVDASGAIVTAVSVADDVESSVFLCTDDQGLTAGAALDAENIKDFGPYRNASTAGFNLIAIEVAYSDGTVLSLGSVEEVAWVLVQ